MQNAGIELYLQNQSRVTTKAFDFLFHLNPYLWLPHLQQRWGGRREGDEESEGPRSGQTPARCCCPTGSETWANNPTLCASASLGTRYEDGGTPACCGL